MRTTLTVDDDLMKRLKDEAHERGVPLKSLIDKLLRLGLSSLAETRPQEPYECPTFSMGHPTSFDLDKALALASTLEDDEIARKLELRK